MFFDSLYKIVGAKFNGKYTSYEELNDTQKVIAILTFSTSHIGFFSFKRKINLLKWVLTIFVLFLR